MQKDNFENNIQQSFADFQLQPTDAVWKLVEQRLAKKKQRRILFFWMLFGLLLMCGGTLVVLSNRNSINITTKETKEVTGEKTANLHRSKKELSATANDEEIPKNLNSATIAKVKEAPFDATSRSGHTSIIRGSITTNNKALFNDASTTSNHKVTSVQNESKIDSTFVLTYQGDTNKPSTTPPSNRVVSNDTLIDLVSGLKGRTASVGVTPNTKVTAPENTASSTGKVATKDSSIAEVKLKLTIPKWRFGTTLNIGLSNNVQGLNIGSKALSFNPNYSSVGSSAGSFTANPAPYKSNLGFGAGFFANYQVRKRVAISFGLQYQYYSYTSTVGARVNSTTSFFDSSMGSGITVKEYYRSGSNNKFVNRLHFIATPVNLLLQVNKKQHKPINLSIGVTPGLLLYSRALYYNNNFGIYYRDNKQLKRLQLAAQAGITFPVLNSSKYGLFLGPTLQYNFSNLTRSFVGSQEHLVYPSIKANVLFKK